MSDGLDEHLLDAVTDVGRTEWSGQVFRYAAARREPLSGEGARLFGGRWNPPDLFPTTYLAQPVGACMAELQKAASDNHIRVADQLQIPYRVHTIRVRSIPVLDLREENTLRALGLGLAGLGA